MKRNETAGKNERSLGGYLLALAVVLIGVAGSLYLWNSRRRSEENQVAAAFRMESRNVFSMIRRELTQYVEVLDSVGHLHSLSADVKAETFREFVQKGMMYQQSILGVFGLAPGISGSERAPYETAMRRQTRPDYSILELRDGQWVPAAQRNIYFPISYIISGSFDDLPIGYDLYSDPDNARGMTYAAEQAGVQAGGLVHGRQGDGRLMLSPIQLIIPGPNGVPQRTGSAHGYAFSIMYPSNVMARIRRQHIPEGLNVQIREASGAVIVTLSSSPQSSSKDSRALRYEESLAMNGLNWVAVSEATDAFVAKRRTKLPWVYLIGGLLISGVLGGQIAQLAGRARRVRRLVAERTRELEQANTELEREIGRRHELQRQIIDISTQEKKRVGRDLHDSLGQQLTGIGLLSSALAKRLDQAQQQEMAAQARQIAELLKEARAATRRMAHGLTPVELDVEALPEALEKLAREVQESSGVQCSFEWWGKLDGLQNEQAINLYHIAQEALNNAVRHSGAKNIRLELGSMQLKITDDGRGIKNVDDVLRSRQGLGLKIMRYRAETACGTLDIQSNPGQGVVITCILQSGCPARKEEPDV